MNFNPRPLAGATTGRYPRKGVFFDFNPRPLAGATQDELLEEVKRPISIHAPLRGRPLYFFTLAAQ